MSLPPLGLGVQVSVTLTGSPRDCAGCQTQTSNLRAENVEGQFSGPQRRTLGPPTTYLCLLHPELHHSVPVPGCHARVPETGGDHRVCTLVNCMTLSQTAGTCCLLLMSRSDQMEPRYQEGTTFLNTPGEDRECHLTLPHPAQCPQSPTVLGSSHLPIPSGVSLPSWSPLWSNSPFRWTIPRGSYNQGLCLSPM